MSFDTATLCEKIAKLSTTAQSIETLSQWCARETAEFTVPLFVSLLCAWRRHPRMDVHAEHWRGVAQVHLAQKITQDHR